MRQRVVHDVSLALKYRPRTFAEVTGQKLTAIPIYRMARLGTLPKALLLAGPRGCGKTSLARILGAALNCELAGDDRLADRWPCGKCPSCQSVAAGNSLDVIEVDAASNGGVDAARKLADLMLYGSPGTWKVLILDEAHAMSRDAFNAWLKIMEEPPPNTLFVLLTTEPGKILATIESRCMTFLVRPVPADLIVKRLAKICQLEQIDAEPALLTEIADRADGGMRDAVMKLDQARCTLVAEGLTLANYEKVFGNADIAVPVVAAMAAGDIAAVYVALEEAVAQAGEPRAVIEKLADLLADLLTLRCGGTIRVQGAPLAARKELAARLDPRKLTKAMKALWDYETRVRVEDRRAALKLAAVVVTEHLCPQAPAVVKAPAGTVNGNGHGETSLDDLRAALGAS